MECPAPTDEAKPICVVIDTNIWRSELLLRSASGAALLFNLKQNSGVLGMPEVIEREIVKHAVAAATEFIENIQSNSRKLNTLTRSMTVYKVPTLEELETRVQRRLEELRSLFLPVSFTLQHAKAALDRVDSELPPNGRKNQQYKDSAIWEAILELARSHEVYFLTNDRAFYKDPDKPAKGVAENLSAECRASRANVRVYRDVASCLEDLEKTAAPLDQDELANAIEATIGTSRLENAATDRGYNFTGKRSGVSISVFPTDKIATPTLTFELTYRLADTSENETASRLEPTLTVKGNCFYELDDKTSSHVVIDEGIFRWKDLFGHEFTNSCQIDQTTGTRQFNAAETKFMIAMQGYKQKTGRMFPMWSEVLQVLRSLGYRDETGDAGDAT